MGLPRCGSPRRESDGGAGTNGECYGALWEGRTHGVPERHWELLAWCCRAVARDDSDHRIRCVALYGGLHVYGDVWERGAEVLHRGGTVSPKAVGANGGAATGGMTAETGP